MHTTRHCLSLGISVLALSLGSAAVTAAYANTYPSKPIRLVIGFGAGGITDVAGRVVAQALSEELGQPVVVENRPGAGAGIAAAAVSQSAPDGYTLLLGTVGTQVVNNMIYKKLAYDPAALTPVSLVSNSPYVLALAAASNAQAKDLGELAAWSKANPGKLNFGSAGNGSAPHLCLELLRLSSKVDMTHVPFKSGAEAVNASIAGQVDAVCDAITVIEPHVKAGRLKMLAMGSDKRSAAAPDVPTGVEQGVVAFQVGSWNALLGPAGMDAQKVETLNKALEKAMVKPAIRKRLSDMGIDTMPLGTKAYADHVTAETAKWSKVVQAAGTRLD
ncbi:Bug family tripartite tricarboxylate transporter substrate binding protein [Pectobacterium actinidiae]|uniref:Bug family tripartite tricarboxylate transporter substrate binding protein n=1 Tax=Pectobacterium actinidiae TaxID=1507808 RepID=UPI0038219355